MSNPPSPSPRLTFIGGGNMARSLIGGLIDQGSPASSIRVAEPNATLRTALQADFGVTVGSDNPGLAESADVIVLAVKPQVMAQVCAALASILPRACLVVSVAAGITTEQLDRWLGGGRRIVRVMPNTPALVGAGASGLFANAGCDRADRDRAEALLAAVGCCVWIEQESLMDAVTALSGSGPAYVFLLAEAMQAAAERQGLPAAAARALTVQTLVGAARMLQASDEPAANLRARVTSPGGTTQAAVEALQAGGFVALLDTAIAAATQRGAELSRAAGG